MVGCDRRNCRIFGDVLFVGNNFDWIACANLDKLLAQKHRWVVTASYLFGKLVILRLGVVRLLQAGLLCFDGPSPRLLSWIDSNISNLLVLGFK